MEFLGFYGTFSLIYDVLLLDFMMFYTILTSYIIFGFILILFSGTLHPFYSN